MIDELMDDMECGISEVEDMTNTIVDTIVEWGWDRFWVSRNLPGFPAFEMFRKWFQIATRVNLFFDNLTKGVHEFVYGWTIRRCKSEENMSNANEETGANRGM